MRRSIGWHFLLYSLAIILVAIVAVGAVTLVLVEANFSKQEEQYLLDRGDQLVEPLESALRLGSDSAGLQDIASLGLVTGHVRVRILDSNGRVLADSGSYDELFELDPRATPPTPLQALLDEFEHYGGFRLPAGDLEAFRPFMMPGGHMAPFGPSDSGVELLSQPLIAEVSDAAVSLPLHVDDQFVGHAELSEGPAYGQVIRQTLQKALLVGGLVALVVAAIAAVVAARQVTRPLLSLGSAADEMARGNLRARASGSELAEVDRLATQFNSMADQLESTIASLEAERQSLRRFIADASHELRTPLTALKTFNTLLTADLASVSGPQAELLHESDRQLNHLDQLTTDLLDLSRLEARLTGVVLHPADIRPVVEDAVAALSQLGATKGQTLELNLPPHAVIATHDPAMLQRAIQNLVSNAVKFAPERGLVKVSLVVGNERVSIHVEDDGPGIPAEDADHIFDRFYRGRSASGEGSGLGLAIAREIAHIHSGTITFTSVEGQGSHFVLDLPLMGSLFVPEIGPD